MIFSSPVFIFIFFPVTLAGFLVLGRTQSKIWPQYWLIAASLFFYSWWRIEYTPLILASICGNYLLGLAIASASTASRVRWLFALGVTANIIPLFLFKYLGFFVREVLQIERFDESEFLFLLPLGISFYTFQQIAYLGDVARNRRPEYSFRQYALFTLFFPHLIAGPIVFHKEFVQQLGAKQFRRIWLNLALGISLISIGLFKKLVVADQLAIYVNPVFAAAASAESIPALTAWSAAISYPLQLYFDFSGYSDIAIGLARCFGTIFPINFNSPYKATSVSDFWRRWHMTLFRFVNRYFFQPITTPLMRLAVSRRMGRLGTSLLTVVLPVVTTFCLIGFWHGAGWKFAVFGLIHGAIVAGETAWRQRPGRRRGGKPGNLLFGRVYLFLVLTLTLVLFRAADLDAAAVMLSAMLDPSRLGQPPDLPWAIMTATALAVIWFLPNAYEMTARYRPALLIEWSGDLRESWIRWRPNAVWAVMIALLFACSVVAMSRGVVEFLYFDF